MTQQIESYGAETAALLQKIQTTLEQDGRITAAWLFGSRGCGTADALSDIDIWVIVQDAAFADLMARKRAFVQAMGTAVLILEAPHNAPPNGAYLAVQFDAPTASHHVDWYWQPQTLAVRAPETQLLFAKEPIPTVAKAIDFPVGEPDPALLSQPNHFISYFWMILQISAKAIWRQPAFDGIPYLEYFIGDFHKTKALLQRPQTWQNTAVTLSGVDKIDWLLRLAEEMRGMMALLARGGTAVPSDIVSGAFRYLEMIRAALA